MKKITLLFLFLFSFNVFAQESIKVESSMSFEKTLTKLETDIKAKGLTVFAKIDHKMAAKKVKLEMMPATVIIFGNPSVGTMLMNDNMDWSYELPLKIAVYEDKDGKVWIKSRQLAKDVSSPAQKKSIDAVNGLIMNLVTGKK